MHAARPAQPDVQLPAGTALRQPRAGRRGEPGTGEDPGRAARGDAGATGDRRWHHHPLEPPFLVVATQNPIEYEGTYPLPEAQLDRFILRTAVGYPSLDDEWNLLARRMERGTDEVMLDASPTRRDCVAMQASLECVHVDEAIGRYVVALVDATRNAAQLQVGASPRAASP